MKKLSIITIATLACLQLAMAQSRITGKVKDEDSDEGIPGVTVLVDGTNNGTITDVDGNFTLVDVADNATLNVSYIGFKTQRISVNGQTSFDITLEVDISDLEEVVVVGYGSQLKRDLTGSVGSVKAEDLVVAPTPNFDQALAGRIAGVSVTASDGTPGSNANIVIRGGNSITGDNSPLYVIDGVPLQDFDPASLNTNDIKSFDVLKDASATAIYGSRGANGVILITTKSGRSDGKTEVTLDVSQGFQYAPTRLEVMNPYQYVTYLEQQAYIQDGYAAGSETQNFREIWVDPELYRGVEGTSWQDEIFREATFQNYSLSVSGGNRDTKIYYSGQYLKQGGIVINTSFDKVVNNLRLDHRVNEDLKFNVNIVHSISNRNGVNINGNGFSGIVIRDVIRFRPVEPINDDGLDGFDPDEEAGRFLFNPVDDLNNTDRRDRRELFRGIFSADYQILKSLKIEGTASFQSQNRRESLFFGQNTFQGSRGNNAINGGIDNSRLVVTTGSGVLRYTPKLRNRHKLSVLGGMEAQTRSIEASGLSSTQIPTDNFGINNLGIGLVAPIPTSNLSESTLLSYFGRLTYNFKRRYLATVNFRADGSSKFREENRWGYFPSFSLAWVVADEPFLAGSNLVSNLKLRAGWGRTGNNRIGDFDAFTTLAATNTSGYVFGPDESYIPGAIVNNLGVPDLTWETTSQYNVGVDFGFLEGKVQGEVDLYLKRTTDLLLNADMASSTGFERVQQNVGEVENRGLEITLRTYNFSSKKFSWTSNFNIAFNQNEVIALNQGQDAIFTDPDRINLGEFHYITQVGEPVGQIFGLQFDGLYQTDDFVWNNETQTFDLRDGIPDNGGRPAPGSVKYVDVNGDGTINEEDRTIIGNTVPKFIGGLNNNFKFFGFDLNVFFQWSYGAEILNLNRVEFESPSGSRQNAFVDVLDQWTPSNTNTDIHTLRYQNVFGRPINGNRISDLYVEDGSFIRLKTISLGYNLSKKVLGNLPINTCRISVSAQNLVTWTKYSGYDPEVGIPPRGGQSRALAPNLDFSAYPQSVTVTGGVRVTF
ncbi:MAG: TonB-dependent receptor [Bacteroidota bacterium]